MKETIKYYCERLYPYIVSLVIISFVVYKKIDIIHDGNMNSALDGVNTFAALIIGFLGAMLPVVLGMKNESKIVKYVFEKDEKKLFLKYIKSTIKIGLLLVCVTIGLYFRKSFADKTILRIIYLWIFLLGVFVLCTYRCLSNMLNLIFSRDSDLEDVTITRNTTTKTKREIEMERKYKA